MRLLCRKGTAGVTDGLVGAGGLPVALVRDGTCIVICGRDPELHSGFTRRLPGA